MKTKILVAILALVIVIGAGGCVDNANNPAGNTNIQVINFTLPYDLWKPVIFERSHWYQRINAPEITNDIFNYGTVYCYFLNNQDAWVPLPSNNLFPGDTLDQYKEVWFSYLKGFIDFDYRDNSKVSTYPYYDIKIKAVILSESFTYSNTYSFKPGKTTPQYSDLKKMYNLKD